MLNLAGKLYLLKHCFIPYIDILIGCYVTVKRKPIGRLQKISQKLQSLEKLVKMNTNKVWHEGHIAGVSFYIHTFILGFTSNHISKIERNVSVKYENKILSRPRTVFSTSSSVCHPSSRYDIMYKRKFRTLSCKNARMWTIMKFVLQILHHNGTFLSETLYYRYSCIRSVFLTHIFNWLHVCDKIHVVCHLSAINWNYMLEIFSMSIF